MALSENPHILAVIKGVTFGNDGRPKYRVEFVNVPKKKEFYYGEVVKAPI